MMVSGMRVSVEKTLDVFEREYVFEIEGIYSSGGSRRWGSDEPPWEEVDITSITCKGKEVSDKTYAYLVNNYDLTEIVLEDM